MAFESIDIPRYIFYALDFIFGTLSWGITADKLVQGPACFLNRIDDTSGGVELINKAPCNAVIALGVIAMIILLVIVVLRTLDIVETLSFEFAEIIETISFGLMTLIWFSLAVVIIAMTTSLTRQFDDIRAAIAGAWLAFFTHIGSIVISVFAHRQTGK